MAARGAAQPVSADGHRVDRLRRGRRAVAAGPAPHPRDGCGRRRGRARCRSSSSTARISPIVSRGAFARRAPRHPDRRLRLAVGVGVAARAAPARCARTSIMCSALLPFEPEVHARLGGPPCTYVGHPLIETDRGASPERRGGASPRRRSRRSCWCCRAAGAARSSVCSDVSARPFGVSRRARCPFELVLPTVPHLVAEVAAGTARLEPAPRIIVAQWPKSARPFAPPARRLPRPGPSRWNWRSPASHGRGLQGQRGIEAMILRRLIRVPSVILANLVSARTSCRNSCRKTARRRI